MGKTLYNDIEKYPCSWLENLSGADLIAPGDVLCGDIRDIDYNTLKSVTQFHTFAGIGIWSHALKNVGWPDSAEVWTGSCPCQPFSVAGARKGFEDERHLWPDWLDLIKQCRPATIFGEQVATKSGRDWLSSVRVDLEKLGYVVGAADLCAAGAGAPHLRQRLFFGASLAHPDGKRFPLLNAGFQRQAGSEDGDTAGSCQNSVWSEGKRFPARDGNYRTIQPGIEPLVDGTPNFVGRTRAYGNGIVSTLASIFIRSFVEAFDG